MYVTTSRTFLRALIDSLMVFTATRDLMRLKIGVAW